MSAEHWLKANVPAYLKRMIPSARLFVQPVEDGLLQVLRTKERSPDQSKWLWHLSVSHSTTDAKPGRYPTWDEQKDACWSLCPGVRMASYMPAEGDPYVNEHETTFHWWEVDQWV